MTRLLHSMSKSNPYKTPPVKLEPPEGSKKPLATIPTAHALTPRLVAWFIRQYMKDFTGIVSQGAARFEFEGGVLKVQPSV